jgi:dolichol-phosphate mannosyltransferase
MHPFRRAKRGSPRRSTLSIEETELIVDTGTRFTLFADGALAGPDLTIVIPTFNERANVPILVERLAKALPETTWEVIFVDDNSPDGTGQLARALGRSDNRVRCISRIGRRGLAGAAIEGMLAAQGRYVAVMDGDLQHDEELLVDMLRILQSEEADLVVGSRYVFGDATSGLSPGRQMASRFASALAKRVLGVQISDPMSGFFMMPSASAPSIAEKLWSSGFKLLMDILATTKGQIRVREIPYLFRAREHGVSKLDSNVIFDFFVLLVTRAACNVLPPRFVGFVLVGSFGVLVHIAALAALIGVAVPFARAQAIATLVAMTSNFFLDNALTYRDQRLSGLRAVKGLLIFYLICGIGALSNVGVASWFYVNWPVWWAAGLLGSVIGAFWNYTMSSTAVWRSGPT